MIDRLIAPTLNPITKIDFVKPEIIDLGSDSALYWMKKVPNETVRIELNFDAGSARGKKAIAGLVNALLFSGTKSKSSRVIHEELDELGAYLDHDITLEQAVVSIYCLRKNVESILNKVYEAIEGVVFLEQELEDVIREKKQRLLVSQEKVGFLARQQFQKYMFDGIETYARYTELSDFEKIETKDLRSFHQENYLKGLKKVVVVANLDEQVIKKMVSKLSLWTKPASSSYESKLDPKRGVHPVEKKGAIQTAIRMGMPLFNKNHPDFIDFQVLQTIFGDYFGSRLMSNIREDKGYTYGIGCGLVEMNKLGYFVIVTEVATDVAKATFKEIAFELKRLQEEKVPLEELNLVKNYLLGQLLKSADGPNAMMDMFIGVEQHGLDLDFYQDYMKKVQEITPERIQELAIKYLDWSNFTIIEAGERN